MPVESRVSAPSFRRRLLGYSAADVDRFVERAAQALASADAEVARLREHDPMQRIGDEVADMLRALASSVEAVQLQAGDDALRVLEQARAEAAQIREEAECFAEALVDRLLGGAIDKLGGVVGARERLRSALVEARRSADTALAALDAAGTIDLDALAAEGNGHHEIGATTNGDAPHPDEVGSALVHG